ncbi:MAG TPA: hypothetical protein VN958_05930, partial [Chitinophagaceae bacterium]|nr:hypothetical protein [Chitinophagaceae bacterium]
DAQIGRFTQLDPLTWDYPELTPYQYASDEPIANVDMDGLESLSSVTTTVVGDVATSGFYHVVTQSIRHLQPAVSKIGSVTVKAVAKTATQAAEAGGKISIGLKLEVKLALD